MEVRPFSDPRWLDARAPGRILHSDVEPRLLNSTGSVRVHGCLVTRLIMTALRDAGYSVVSEIHGWGKPQPDTGPRAVLEGRIWSFEFLTNATTLLDVDLTLSLYGKQTAEMLWQSEFPDADGLPFWVGLGCKPEETIRTALQAVEEAARERFSSEHFAEVVGWDAEDAEQSRVRVDATHELVSEASWTGTDAGEISATAHESAAAPGATESPGSDPKPAFASSLADGASASR